MVAAMNALKILIVATSICLVKGSKSTGNEDCHRLEKFSEIGYDKGKTIEIDVGECNTRMNESSAVNPSHTSVSNTCIPLHMTEERHLLFNGFFMITEQTIQTCQNVKSNCQRLPRMITFYPETVYNTTIDVGVCGGVCRDQVTCKPIWTKLEAIPSPDGKRPIPIIVNCSCVKPYCYRVAKFEGFLELYSDAEGNNATRTKIVDMGKCVSESMCPLDKWPPLPTKCKAKVKFISFVSSGERRISVSIVKRCYCQ